LNGSITVPSNQDVVFKGNVNKWIAFANAIKLRMLIRMSNVTGDMATVRNQQIRLWLVKQ
jgi:hypothetical protein